MERTGLVAPGVRSFIDLTLKNCRHLKETYTNIAWNVGLTLFLIFGLVTFLYYRYRGKLSPEGKAAKEQEAHFYIMKKLGNNVATREIEKGLSNGTLTGLPLYDKALFPNQGR